MGGHFFATTLLSNPFQADRHELVNLLPSLVVILLLLL